MTWVEETPRLNSDIRFSSFGIIPPVAFPDAIIARASLALRRTIFVDSSFGSRYIPFTSDRRINFSAPSRAAISDAIVSALML